MIDFKKLFLHLKVIRTHRKYVRRLAFKLGIPWQGLIHDLSKYSLSEMQVYKYATGKKSPHQSARDEIGLSPCHNLHKHINKHHPEFWYDIVDINTIIPLKIPYRYVVEMFCDMVSTGKTYYGKDWKCSDPYEYYLSNFIDKKLFHEKSAWLLSILLEKLAEIGSEKEFVKWYRKVKKVLIKSYNDEI